MSFDTGTDLLLSLPPNMCRQLDECEPDAADRVFAAFDPPERQLGSGGGTAYLLEQAWQAGRAANDESFDQWLHRSVKLIVHGGGESRRLPAYAPEGKLFIPIPVFRWAVGQRLDQTLLDVIEPNLRRLAKGASSHSRVMVASGDVYVQLPENLPPIPEADVVFIGLWTTPEVASHFGVFLTDPAQPEHLVSFLQKPTPEEIRIRSRHHAFLIDVGIWLLSEQAVGSLMTKCGWDADGRRFATDDGRPATYDLYGRWALHLGESPQVVDPNISGLRTAVVPLPGAEFHHVGTGKDLVDSVYAIQNAETEPSRLGSVASMAQPRQFVQNSLFDVPLRRDANHSLWVENSVIPDTWTLASRHILTGVPDNDWTLDLPEGTCLDFVPLTDGRTALRAYGYFDGFRGAVGSEGTQWFERPAIQWFRSRGIRLEVAGLAPDEDIQNAALFPVLNEYDGSFIRWMTAADPPGGDWAELWLRATRISARELAQKADLATVYRQRDRRRSAILPTMASHAEHSVFYKLDLEHTAAMYANSSHPLPDPLVPGELRRPLTALHERMFRAAVMRRRGAPKDADRAESQAFGILHDLIVDPIKTRPSRPRLTVLKDQIVWGRSPVRLDMAGGWADTPPYCLERGGAVTNIAVDLNGQPPIQVFAQATEDAVLSIRSIDLGVSETLRSYDDVGAYRTLDSGFALARAAFAAAGFHPDFNGGAYAELGDQLSDLGGGVEISMVAAIPKGSGLGTSSILAATILGVLSDLCGLGWTKREISRRTLALEQMLSSGGGWQDQVGGLFGGIKLITTRPGLDQSPEIRWLPDDLFRGPDSERMLLYYTGITRVARNILGDIVRGIFLNARDRLAAVDAIAANARFCHDALQRGDAGGFVESVRRSWWLNQKLDEGTNPPDVQAILDCIALETAAAKLLGAGGGGYLFIVARDRDAARRIRGILETDPPNAGARFVSMSVSRTGLQVTRS